MLILISLDNITQRKSHCQNMNPASLTQSLFLTTTIHNLHIRHFTPANSQRDGERTVSKDALDLKLRVGLLPQRRNTCKNTVPSAQPEHRKSGSAMPQAGAPHCRVTAGDSPSFSLSLVSYHHYSHLNKLQPPRKHSKMNELHMELPGLV